MGKKDDAGDKFAITSLENNGVFPQIEWKFSEFGEFRKSNISPRHEFDQFRDPRCYLYLVGCW